MVGTGQRRLAFLAFGALLAAGTLAGPARAETQSLPWGTFSEASADTVAVGQVLCPGAPEKPVLKARLTREQQDYVYMARDRRWLLWRVPGVLSDGAVEPGYVWFGSQDPSDDVMHVVQSMPYEEAQKYFRGPCGWIENDTI